MPGLVAGEPAPTPFPVPGPQPDKDKDKDKEKDKDKSRGPEHNVTLPEEPAVLDLLARAQKARVRAEKDPEVWPECVKHYSEILKKYSNTVYLDRWEGPDKSDPAFKNGVYKSTRERVAKEIATLPPAALAIYRVTSDPPAKNLFAEGTSQCDERKIEQVVRDYFSSSVGDDALVWLAEAAADRGAYLQAITRLNAVLLHPSKSISTTAALTRIFLSQAQVGDKTGAENTLAKIAAAMNDGANGALRVGNDEGEAALNKLKQKLASIKAQTPEKTVAGTTERAWETYFGNSAHTRTAAGRAQIGIRKWSIPITELLYGPGSTGKPEGETVQNDDGQTVPVIPMMNTHLTARDGLFYVCDHQVIAGYPINNPAAGPAANGGNAKLLWPSNAKKAAQKRGPNARYYAQMTPTTRQHPYFCTLDSDRIYAVVGPEFPTPQVNFGRGRRMQEDAAKTAPNYLTALSRSGGEKVELWSLQPESPAFQMQSKADQEWLKAIFFVSAPAYDAGSLYAAGVTLAGNLYENWVASFDADTGRLLWRTQVCSAAPMNAWGVVSPDYGLPVAVSNGTVYSVTNLGAVAALEGGSGAVKWIRVYDRLKVAGADMFGRGDQGVRDFWGPNPPIVYNNLLICTPQDSKYLYAFDLDTGKRVWQLSRLYNDQNLNDPNDNSADSRGMKHILGIVNGTLAVTGSDQLQFFNVKNGKLAVEAITTAGEIRGRGTVAGNTVMVPTDRALLSFETALQDGRFVSTEKMAHKWTDPAVEPGHITIAGDVLFTVGTTHVNAYFVWEEIEARLSDRIKTNAADISAYIELADIYKGVDRIEQGLAEIERGLAAAAKAGSSPAEVASLHSKKVDLYIALGEKAAAAKTDAPLIAAKAQFEKAYEAAIQPNVPGVMAIHALRARTDNAEARKDAAEALKLFQQMIMKHGDVVFTFQKGMSLKARLHGQARIAAIRKANPELYAPIEAEAKAALEQAGADSAKLNSVLLNYPNSDACAMILLKLAELSIEKSPDRARQYAENYLSRFKANPEAAYATALLARAFDQARLYAQAKTVLSRLASKAEFADKSAPIEKLDPAKKGETVKIAEWAKERLKESIYAAPTRAIASLGDGKPRKAWSKNMDESGIPLFAYGLTPAEARGMVFYVENQGELVALSGRDGEELWLPRQKTPVSPTRGVWVEHLLLVCGQGEIIAYDSRENGRVAWSYSVRQPYAMQVRGGRIILTHSGNTLLTLDTSGAEQWTKRVDGIAGSQLSGDDFIAILGGNPQKLSTYDLETGAPRFEIDLPAGYSHPPVAAGDRIYLTDRTNQLVAYDASSGKKLWERNAGQVQNIKTAGDHVFTVVNGRAIVVFNADGAGEGQRWVDLSDSVINDMYIDADDLYVATTQLNRESMLNSYSISRQGKINWRTAMAPEPNSGNMRIVNQGGPVIINNNGNVNQVVIMNGRQVVVGPGANANFMGGEFDTSSIVPLSEQSIAREHVILAQTVIDTVGGRPSNIVVIDRRTGKLTQNVELHADNGAVIPAAGSFKVQLFDGGIVIVEGRIRTGHISGDAGLGDDIQSVQARLDKNPGDIELRAKLLGLQYEKGDREKILADMSGLLGDPKLDDAKFTAIYQKFTLLRKHNADTARFPLEFTRVNAPIALDGNAAAWEKIPAVKFDSWRHVYIANDEDAKAQLKKNVWSGAGDLSVTFRGAYDEKNLYMYFAVKDDSHKNEQAEANTLDYGDSIKLVFDSDHDRGLGFRGEDFELGAALGKDNKTLAWRWVEHAKYVRGQTPLENGAVVQRKEGEKLTTYQFTLPLEYLTLKPQAGLKFGFTFVVNDQDGTDSVEKSAGPNPGALRPAVPQMFSEGILKN